MKIKNLYILIIILSVCSLKVIAVNLAGENSPNGHPTFRWHSDNPDYNNIKLLPFLKQYNNYKNFQIINAPQVISLREIDRFSRLTKSVIFNFDSLQCKHDSKCQFKKDVKYSIDLNVYKQELISALKYAKIPYNSKNYKIYLFVFFNEPFDMKNIKINNQENISYKIYLVPDLFNRWLSIIEKYNPIELERELELFNMSKNSSKCLDIKSPYCLIKNNDKKGILKYIKQQQSKKIKSIKLDLLLDFAYITNNNKLSILFTKLKLKSIYYPDKKAKLYAAAYNYDVEIVEFLLNDTFSNKSIKFDINSEYSSGVTLLDVAVASSSYNIMKILIENGANKSGELSMYYMSKSTKSDKTKIYKIFEIYYQGFKNKKTPDILRNVITGLIDIRGENILQWFDELYKRDPQLFKSVFIDSDEYAHRAILNSGLRETPDMFDFLINHGVDICFTFDKRSMKYFGYTMKKDKQHWLNTRYKEYLKKCKKDEN